MRLCPQKLPYRSPGEALLPGLPLPKASFLAARTLRIGRGFTEPGVGMRGMSPGWPAVWCRLGAFLAAPISLFWERRGLESREMNPLRTVMNAGLQQCRLGSAAWLMTRERTRGKCNGRANLCRVPALDKIRRLTPTEESAEGLKETPHGAGGQGRESALVWASEPWVPACPESQPRGGRPPSAPTQVSAPARGSLSCQASPARLLADTFFKAVLKGFDELAVAGQQLKSLALENGRKQVKPLTPTRPSKTPSPHTLYTSSRHFVPVNFNKHTNFWPLSISVLKCNQEHHSFQLPLWEKEVPVPGDILAKTPVPLQMDTVYRRCKMPLSPSNFHVCTHVWPLSYVQLLGITWTVAHQAPLSIGFSRQAYWSG